MAFKFIVSPTFSLSLSLTISIPLGIIASTVSSNESAISFCVAVIVTIPGDFAFKYPDSFISAIDVSLEVHFISCDVVFFGVNSAFKMIYSEFFILSGLSPMLIFSTVISSTVISNESKLSFCVAIIVTVPTDNAFKYPVLST